MVIIHSFFFFNLLAMPRSMWDFSSLGSGFGRRLT